VVARRVTAQSNKHLDENTTDDIFSITYNMDVALMRPKWIFDKPMSLCSKNIDLGIYEQYYSLCSAFFIVLKKEVSYLTKKDGSQYAYSVARIRVMETKMLDKSKIDRMVEAKSPEEVLKMLVEANYGLSSGETVSPYEYEKLLTEENTKVYKLLKEIAPEPEVFQIFLIKNDYHNVKVLLKAEFLEKAFDELLIDSGTVPVSKLKMVLKERKLEELHITLRQAIEECIDTFNRTRDPQIIDLILDKASYVQMKERAEEVKSEFLVDLIKVFIDLNNIKAFLRVRALHKSFDFLRKVLLPGGSIQENLFINIMDYSNEDIIHEFHHTPYGAICEEGINNYQNTGSLTRLEKLCDDYIIHYIKKAKYVSLGIEPLVAYLLAKENEIKIVRVIMVGKMNGIPNEIIRERLREVYV